MNGFVAEYAVELHCIRLELGEQERKSIGDRERMQHMTDRSRKGRACQRRHREGESAAVEQGKVVHLEVSSTAADALLSSTCQSRLGQASILPPTS